jgi:hypothetical protein
MTPSDRQQLKAYLEGAASILYRNTDPTELKTFESIEKALRQKILSGCISLLQKHQVES